MSTEETKTESAPSRDAKPESVSTPPNAAASSSVRRPLTSTRASRGRLRKRLRPERPGPPQTRRSRRPRPLPKREPAPGDSGVMTAPEPPRQRRRRGGAAADDEMPAATPQQEMGLSNSTLHWLEDGEQAIPGRLTEPGTMPSYDPRAPVPGRKRAYLVTGGAALIALIVAGALYGAGAEAPRRGSAGAGGGRTRARSHDARRGRAGGEPDRRGDGAGAPGAGRRPALRRRALRGRDDQAGRATRPPRRAASFASISSWLPWERTPQRRARPSSLCRHDRDAPSFNEPAAAGGSEGALCGRRTRAARVDRGRAGR